MYDRPFRWWVQSVMPLVFDDSLSYYEVLAKLTKYIEGLTGDVEQIEKIIGTIEGIEDITQFTEMLESIKAEIGNLSNLSTQSKTDLVSAINEVALKADIAYWKPPTGIPESDLSQEVKDKLNRTVSSTEYIINNVKLNPAPANNSPTDLGLGTYTVPDGGIPWNTLSSDVRDRITGSGSGGTTNYGDLNNKPQINGHTLNAGNNTAESLELGTYSKPIMGIPESDLTAEVQEKLNTSGSIADSESSFVATRDYTAGELIYINGQLYRTKYNILAGTTLIPGNNIEVTDINAELEKINSDIEALQSGGGPDSWSLVADLTSNSTINYVNFFEYFNAIGGENYLFICTPNSTNESPYEITILKRDGTVVYTFNSQSVGNQERFTFTPVDNGEYYCRIKKFETTPPTETNAVVNVKLEYTQSQGMTELWSKVNEAIAIGENIDAIEVLVNQHTGQIENLIINNGNLLNNTSKFVSPYNDFDTFTQNECVLITTNPSNYVDNIPSGFTAGWVLTFNYKNAATGGLAQIVFYATTAAKGRIAWRKKWGSTWGTWYYFDNTADIVTALNASITAVSTDATSKLVLRGYNEVTNASHPSLTDANNAEVNRIYSIQGTNVCANLPESKQGTLITFNYKDTGAGKIQLFHAANGGLYSRIYWTEWRSWIKYTSFEDVEKLLNTAYKGLGNFIACGDSITRSLSYPTQGNYVLVKSWATSFAELCGSDATIYARGGRSTADFIASDDYATAIADTSQFAFLFLGINDINNNVSVADFKTNYTTIVNALLTNHDFVFCVTIPACLQPSASLPNYNMAISEVCESVSNAFLVDITEASTRLSIYKNYGHLSSIGYAMMAGEIAKSVNQAMANNAYFTGQIDV